MEQQHQQVTVSSSPTATVSGGTFCATGTTTLTTTGATGGTFSASPAGLVINATTGVIDLATSTPGTYTVTYSFGTAPCNGTATSAGNSKFITNSNREWWYVLCNRNNNTYNNRSNRWNILCTPAGLVINATTGVIDLAASTPATYTVTYSFGTAPCNGTATSAGNSKFITNSNRERRYFLCNRNNNSYNNRSNRRHILSIACRTCDQCSNRCDRPCSINTGTYTVTYSFGTAPCNGTATSAGNSKFITNSNREWWYFLCNRNNNTYYNRSNRWNILSSPAGLVINAATGVIDLATSTPAPIP